MIAKNLGAFHFWSSIGAVQSSGDVVQDLRSGYDGPTTVNSALDAYVLQMSGRTVKDAIEDVPLEYALTEKRCAHLGRNDAIKAALIGVCKKWHIELRCSSRRGDALEHDVELPVYPLGIFESFILSAIQQAAERQSLQRA